MLIVIDLDETCFTNTYRKHLIEGPNPNWQAYLAPELVRLDPPIPSAQRVFPKLLASGASIVFLTGRNESLRAVTTESLKEHFNVDVDNTSLLMREIGDMRTPTEYKRSHLNRLVYKFPTPWLCIDDDKFMQSVYLSYSAIPLLAPACWDVLFVDFPDLPIEAHWRV